MRAKIVIVLILLFFVFRIHADERKKEKPNHRKSNQNFNKAIKKNSTQLTSQKKNKSKIEKRKKGNSISRQPPDLNLWEVETLPIHENCFTQFTNEDNDTKIDISIEQQKNPFPFDKFSNLLNKYELKIEYLGNDNEFEEEVSIKMISKLKNIIEIEKQKIIIYEDNVLTLHLRMSKEFRFQESFLEKLKTELEKEKIISIISFKPIERFNLERKDLVFNRAGKSKLLFAVSVGNLKSIESLVKQGCDVNVSNERGSTALMIASAKNQLDIVKYLVDNKVNVNAKNIEGKTAISIAEEMDYINIVNFLEEKRREK